MKQTLLIEIEPTHRPRLEVWKERNWVSTEQAEYRSAECAWCAEGGGSQSYGSTELDACEALAEKMGWPGPGELAEVELRIKL